MMESFQQSGKLWEKVGKIVIILRFET